MNTPNQLPESVGASWTDFLETYEPLRADLYRYCRHLARSPWDAEDLAQDTMARAFVTLGQMRHTPPNPRAWLFRVASNLWIDRARRRQRELLGADAPGHIAQEAPDPRGPREAAGTLLGELAPRERAAVVLKDVFGFSLEEAAEALSTSVGAIKAALHRGRGKLVEPAAEQASAPTPAVLDAFCEAFNAGDLDRLTALMLDTVSVEVVGATTLYGPENARRTVLSGMLFGVRELVRGTLPCSVDVEWFRGAIDAPPRVEARLHRGAWVLLHWYSHEDGEAVRALTRVEPDADRICRVLNYFYNPELVAEVCAELGVPFRSNGRRWWPPHRA